LKFKIPVLLILSLTLLLLISCKNEPNAIGIDLIGFDLIYHKTLDSQTDSLTQNSKYYKVVFPLGLASRILIGKYQDIDASTLLKFVFGLPDSVEEDILADSINVTEAKIVLTRNYVLGDTSGTISFTTHKVNSEWSPTLFTIYNLPSLDYEGADVGSNYELTDTTYTFNLSNELVFSWMQNYADPTLGSNEGIYLIPTSAAGTVLGFEAFTALSSNAAKLNIVINKPGVYTDTISGFIYADVSLVEGNIPVLPADNFAVQSSFALNAQLYFDLSSLPKGAVINSAELILTPDTLTTITGSSYNNTLRTLYISDSVNTKVTDGSDLLLNYVNDKYTGNVTSYVRKWVDEKVNYGMLIRPGSQVEGLELFGLKNGLAEYSLRPRLKVVYSIKNDL
jgi:hypothetical protein